MYDLFVLYNRPEDLDIFDRHYTTTHIPLVRQLPLLQDFTWGKVAEKEANGYYVIARLTYASKEEADASMASEAGQASVADLANFAHAGATVLSVPRAGQQ
ncbi:EthD family reductase [Arthrobacter sp. CAU 1506]|uniref:EthD family reductase n=1 Tax=Arthrobacter sp. CAU 1506 TaxID=2560052 RepID=UPI0010AC507D|nr:EthD family reductase [Arthrobacter sp. CAU 1506]TJY66179.1 EthD family reductase [Arthrobacter sp. CAU 1506]